MLKNYKDFQNWLDGFWFEKIPTSKNAWDVKAVKKYLKLIWNLELEASYRVIVWGTAWKWTTVRLTHEILQKDGQKVASFCSPHIICFTERIRLWEKLIWANELLKAANQLIVLLKWDMQDISFYICSLLLFLIASKNYWADILVLEIWLWGEADWVNQILWDRISALTFVWEDHLEILWPKLEDVAKTKAKIFNKNTIAWFSFEKNFRDILKNESPVDINFIEYSWFKADWMLAKNISEFILKKEIKDCPEIKMSARWEMLNIDWKKVILDWAHSKPRIEEILKKIKTDGSIKFFLLSSKDSRDWAYLFPIVNFDKAHIFITEFETNWIKSISSMWLKSVLKTWTIVSSPKKALKKILKMMNTWDSLLVTGSFYLCGIIRELVYSHDDILDQQTEFPIC